MSVFYSRIKKTKEEIDQELQAIDGSLRLIDFNAFLVEWGGEGDINPISLALVHDIDIYKTVKVNRDDFKTSEEMIAESKNPG